MAAADVLIEGYRPGVAERLGIGPDECLAANPGLVYARMTGWGQDGPRAHTAGHDINYLALTGVLHAIGRADVRPVPPLNLVADFGGGSMLILVGILAAPLGTDPVRPGAGGGRGHGRRREPAGPADLVVPRGRRLERHPGDESARRRLPPTTTPTPAPTAGTWPSEHWKNLSGPTFSPVWG